MKTKHNRVWTHSPSLQTKTHQRPRLTRTQPPPVIAKTYPKTPPPSLTSFLLSLPLALMKDIFIYLTSIEGILTTFWFYIIHLWWVHR